MDRALLLAGRGLRAFGFGFAAVLVGVHLEQRGLSAISIGLAIDEPIDGVVRRLSAKGVRFRGPVVRDEKAGIALAFFGDQDGNGLYLCQMTGE